MAKKKPPKKTEKPEKPKKKKELARKSPAKKGKTSAKKPATKPAKAKTKPAKAKTKPAKAKTKPARKPKPAPGGGKGRIHFICSECYEEFILGAAQMKDTLTCPECLHVGKRPDDQFLHTVGGTKSREKAKLVLATLVALLAAIAGGCMVVLLSPHQGLLVDLVGSDAATYIFGGGLGLFFLIGIALAIQYEGNRWEVYF